MTGPNFDRVARIYRFAEYLALGPLLQQTRTHFIPALADRRSAFVLGDGDGRFLCSLLAANMHLQATAVDTSMEMLRLLRKRCVFANDRLQVQKTSAATASIPGNADLVVTHFFLDCLHQDQVNALIRRVADQCMPNTLWLVSDFQVPSRSWLRLAARIYIRLLYLAFRVLTGLRVSHLPETREALQHAGFERIEYKEKLAGLLYAELWRLSSNGKLTKDGLPPGKERASMSHEERPRQHFVSDAQPDPEPAAPSLAEPDPGVFHHEPGTAVPTTPATDPEAQ